MANSSPPSRASTSPWRRHPSRRRETATSSSSPTRWPRLSLTNLEPVEVEVEHGEAIAVAALLEVVQPPAQAFHEQRTVPQARQGVQEPCPPQPLLREHAFGRVGQRPGDSQRPLPCPAHRDTAAHEAAVTAVFVPQAVLVLEELGRPRKVRVERLLERLGVLRVEAANPLFRTADPSRCGQPEHGPPAGRDVELLRAKVPLPEPVGSAFSREGQAFLAPLQPLLDPRPLSDVAPQERDPARHRHDADLQHAGALRPRQVDVQRAPGLAGQGVLDGARQRTGRDRWNGLREGPAERAFTRAVENPGQHVGPQHDVPGPVDDAHSLVDQVKDFLPPSILFLPLE